MVVPGRDVPAFTGGHARGIGRCPGADALDWRGKDNGFGRGLPPRSDNGGNYALLMPLLADERIKPSPAVNDCAGVRFWICCATRGAIGLSMPQADRRVPCPIRLRRHAEPRTQHSLSKQGQNAACIDLAYMPHRTLRFSSVPHPRF